jgi:hypothetical protein
MEIWNLPRKLELREKLQRVAKILARVASVKPGVAGSQLLANLGYMQTKMTSHSLASPSKYWKKQKVQICPQPPAKGFPMMNTLRA